MKAKLIKTPENLYKLKFNNDNDMLLCATALLSSKNCDEIFGIVNIEKLAEEYSDKEYGGGQSPSYFSGFSDGLNKAMELNKDKVFTLEDVKKAYIQGKHGGKTQAYVEFDDYIQSLQQPTEMNVEIEMENYGYCEGCRKAGMWHCAHADTCGNAENRERPKLDSSGNLILKKI